MFLSNERRDALARRVSASPVGGFLTSKVALAFFYGIFLFLYEIKFLRNLVPAVHPVLIGWAAAQVIYDLAVRRVWKSVPGYPLIFLFAASAAVTALLNREAGLIRNMKAWVMSVLPLVSFYPACFREDRRRAMLHALMGAAAVMFAASVAGVVLYLMRFGGTVTFLGMEEWIGFRLYDERFPDSGIIHYGIYTDTNHAAAYAAIFAAYSASLYLACRRGMYHKRWKNRLGMAFGAANFIAQICYFPLANSRGGWLGLGIAGALGFFFYLLCGRPREKYALRAVLSAVAAVLAVAVMCAAVLILRSGLSRASMLGQQLQAQPTEPTVPAVETAAPDSFDKVSTSAAGGRLELWQEALGLWAHSPIFGIGPGNEQHYARQYYDSGMLIYGKAVHNSYLDLLLDYGAVGFGVLALFFGLCAVSVMKRLFSGGRDAIEYLALGALISAAVAAVFLSCAFISTTAMYFVMLILLGYLAAGRERV